MSIFESKPKCEICATREVHKQSKRCSHCKDRYDSNGVAFIIYCEFWRFEPVVRKELGTVRQDVVFRVCDGAVQVVPKGWGWISTDAACLEVELANFRNYRLVHIEPSILP